MSDTEQTINNTLTNSNNTDTNSTDLKNEKTEDYSGPQYQLPVVNPLEGCNFIGFGELEEDFPKCKFLIQSFEEFNESIEDPKKRIYFPSEMTMEIPKLIFTVPKTDSHIKEDGTSGKHTVMGLKESNGRGKGSSLIITTGALICPKGYVESDTGNGIVKSIKAEFNMNNPHDRHFKLCIIDGIIDECAYGVLASPTDFGLTCEAYDSTADRSTKSFKKAFDAARNLFTDPFRLVKIGEKEVDRESPVRILYINPLSYYNKEKDQLNEMKVFLPGTSEPISPSVLENICKGWHKKNGEIVKGKPKGFEASFDLLVTRVVRTSGTSVQIKGLNLYIHRFFDIDYKSAKTEKHLQGLQGRLNADFEQYNGLENFVDPTEESNEGKPTQDNIQFNPMGKSSNNSHTTPNKNIEHEVLPDVPDINTFDVKDKNEKSTESFDSTTKEEIPAGIETKAPRKFSRMKKS